MVNLREYNVYDRPLDFHEICLNDLIIKDGQEVARRGINSLSSLIDTSWDLNYYPISLLDVDYSDGNGAILLRKSSTKGYQYGAIVSSKVRNKESDAKFYVLIIDMNMDLRHDLDEIKNVDDFLKTI